MGSIGGWRGQQVTLVLLACAASMGCSLMIDADRQQCASNSDCEASSPGSACSSAGICENATSGMGGASGSGGAGPSSGGNNNISPDDPMWGCTRTGGLPKPPDDPDPTLEVSMKLTNVVGGVVGETVTARLCKKLEPTCNPPLDTQESDENDVVTFRNIPKNLSAFVWFTSPSTTPGLYFFNPSINQDMANVAVQIATPASVEALTGLLQNPQVDGNGLSLINVVDCAGKPAAGVRFESDVAMEGTDMSVFYAVGSLPTSDATETDSAAFGGFVNIPPRSITVRGVVGPVDNPSVIAKASIFVKPNSLSYLKLVPSGS
jgi:hypothetical protein